MDCGYIYIYASVWMKTVAAILTTKQTVNRCRTRNKSEESVATDKTKHTSEGSTLTSSEVHNRDVTGPTKRTSLFLV